MTIAQIFTAICVFIVCVALFTQLDFYPIHNKQTQKIEFWVDYWSHSDEKFYKFKLFERKIRKN